MPPHSSPTRTIVIGILGVFLIAGFIFWGLKSSKQPTTVGIDNRDTSASEWPSKEMRTETITDSSKGYDISVKYPVAKSDAITAIFKKFAEDQITAFKEDTAGIEDQPLDAPSMALQVTYEIKQTDKVQNYIFSIYTDTGGAHGLMATKTYAFTKTGEVVELADLFTDKTIGLEKVANEAKRELKTREFAEVAWIDEGASPTEDNYQNFIVGANEVTFIFDAYQVAPYAAGAQSVIVPISIFKAVANTDLFDLE